MNDYMDMEGGLIEGQLHGGGWATATAPLYDSKGLRELASRLCSSSELLEDWHWLR